MTVDHHLVVGNKSTAWPGNGARAGVAAGAGVPEGAEVDEAYLRRCVVAAGCAGRREPGPRDVPEIRDRRSRRRESERERPRLIAWSPPFAADRA